MNEIVFNGVHLAIGIVLVVMGFLAGCAYGYLLKGDKYDEELAELLAELDKLKRRSAK